MRISLNWLKRYVDIPVSNEELVKLIGARLVEVEAVIDETHKYDNIFVVKVETAEKIEGTHLTLCQINNGSDELIQVLCGAPNVRAGMLAAWIAPGAIVPASVNEDAPFVIGKRKMLGKYDSNGMLASAHELDFGDDHSGIVEIDPALAQPGVLLADVFDLKDIILDIENKSLTHRPDCFGVIGFAREVAGILGEKFDVKIEDEKNDINNTAIEIEIENKDICKRYTAVVLEKHGEIKKKYLTWVDTILAKSGMRPVDPIVDATNYFMLLTGQPLHAFDYDKFVEVGGVKDPKIIVRLAKDGEKLILLDGKEVELNHNDIVITSNDVPVALAGSMGGASTMIDENTRNIILESATFSLYNLRKTQMEHGIFSEAITRFTKGQPAYQTLAVAKQCADMLGSGFKISSVADKYIDPEGEIRIEISANEINGLLGTNYSEELIIKTLSNVGFTVKREKSVLTIIAPKWRTDIRIKEDIIEEVGRLLGYDNIPLTLPRHMTASPNAMILIKSEIRNIMKEFGANELLTYSFVSERLFKKAGLDPNNAYRIVNSISPELQYVRQSIVPSLLDKAYMNQKMPVDKFAIYEINKVYQKCWGMDNESVPVEKMQMGFVVAERKGVGTAYYKAKKFVDSLLGQFSINAKYLPLKKTDAETLPFEIKRAAEIWVGDEYIGVVGEFKNSVKRNFKLAEYLAGFEINVDGVLNLMKDEEKIKICLNKEQRDLTIQTNENYADVVEKVEKVLKGYDLDVEITPISIYQKDDEKRISLHLEFDTKIDDDVMRKLESI